MADKFAILKKIEDIYKNGDNIMSYLKGLSESSENSFEDIMISYDFQAGSYLEAYEDNKQKREDYTKAIAGEMNNIIEENSQYSVLEVGVGEATTLALMLKYLKVSPEKVYGIDLSWSRVKYAKMFLKQNEVDNTQMMVGDLFNLPFQDNAIDIVYTAHSIEPNTGKELEAIKELYRVSGKYLVLFEPAYELADKEAKERIKKNGYVTSLQKAIKTLGLEENLIKYELLGFSLNPLNPTGVMVIKKQPQELKKADGLCCPVTKTKLMNMQDSYFTPEGFLAYPIIGGIPCLLPQNAIVATKFKDE